MKIPSPRGGPPASQMRFPWSAPRTAPAGRAHALLARGLPLIIIIIALAALVLSSVGHAQTLDPVLVSNTGQTAGSDLATATGRATYAQSFTTGDHPDGYFLSSVEVGLKAERTVTVPLTVTDQDGASPADYSGVPASVTFNSGEVLKTFTFSATRDDVDDDGESVKLTFGTPLPARVSAGTGNESTVNIQSKTPLTASVESAPPSHNGSDEFRIRIALSEEPKTGFSYTTMRHHAFTVTGGSVTGARRLDPPGNIGWEVVIEPDSNGDVSIVLPITTDCDAQGAICTGDGRPLSNRLEITVSGPSG